MGSSLRWEQVVAAIRLLGQRTADGKSVVVQIDRTVIDMNRLKIDIDPNSLRIVLEDPGPG